jgi:hypothetical protein
MTDSYIPAVHPLNPFLGTIDIDRCEIWDILMRHDFEAFVAGDWSMIQADFWEEGFCGIDAKKEPNPSRWCLTFPSLTAYRDEWLRQVREFGSTRLTGTTMLQFLYDSCALEEINVCDNRAIGCKRFDGSVKSTDGRDIVLRFQSLYQLIRTNNRWLIAGFVGYLPNPMLAYSVNNAEMPW